MNVLHIALPALMTVVGYVRSDAGTLQLHDVAEHTDTTVQHPAHSFLFDVAFNSDDVFLGVSYMYSLWKGSGIAAVVRGYARPYQKDVLIPAEPGVYYHLHEQRYGIGGGLDLRYDTGKGFELFSTLLVDYSWADYAGTLRTSAEWVFPTVNAGFGVPLLVDGSFGLAIRAAYQYSAFDTISRHRANVSLVFSLY